MIVEGYRAVGSLNTKMIAFSLRTILLVLLFLLLLLFLLVSVNGETYKSTFKRPIKIRTHHVVRKHLTATVTNKNNK